VSVDPQELLALSRGVRWDFPSSAGKPLRDRADAEPLLARKDDFLAAAAELDVDEATELAANIWRLWIVARDLAGGRVFLVTVLDDRPASRSRWRALALYGDGVFAWWQGEREDSRRRNEEALELAGDDPEALSLARLGVSRVVLEDGDYARAYELAAGARAAAAPLGDAMAQGSLHMHAQATRLAGNYDEAAVLFQESLALNGRIDAPGMVAVEYHNLGHVEIHRGNVAFLRGDLDRARPLLETAETFFAESPMAGVAIDDRFELDWLRDQLR
jgi:tetratricopeptide (TPR) repeat protein